MDSRLLAGAYSKRYKYIERDQIDALKNTGDGEKTDVLSKARRLSQETNRRRKLLAQKRKSEAAREEKRRQEILIRRHQEQQQATEKYQRHNVPTRPPPHPNYSSPRHQGYSRSHTTGLDEALRLVRGSSAHSNSSSMIQRMYQMNTDPLERSYVKSGPVPRVNAGSLQGTEGQGDAPQGHARPQSGTQRAGETSIRSELMERSLRNLTSSRSRFEQQLEHHQQLLIEQQQKSLHEFNEAIQREIDTNTKVQGMEDDCHDHVLDRSESLSSLDSLEEGTVSPLSSVLPGNQAQQEFAVVAGKTEERTGIKQVAQVVNQEQSAREKCAYGQPNRAAVQEQATRSVQGVHSAISSNGHREPGTNTRGTSHIIGPIPQVNNSPVPDPHPSNTHSVQSSYYQDSLEAHPVGERRVAVGTALRLPQAPASQPQVIKQPAPSLQYDSDLLAHRKFESRPYQIGCVAAPSNNNNMRAAEGKQEELYASVNNNSVVTQGMADAPEEYSLPERPKAHVYAWTTPSPAEQHLASNQSPVTSNLDAHSGNMAYAASMAADRVMATKVNPQTSRNTATLATTTWVYQTVNATLTHNRDATYSQAGMSYGPSQQPAVNTCVSSTYQTNNNGRSAAQVSYSTAPQPSYSTSQSELPRGQSEVFRGQDSAMATQTHTGTRLGSGGPPPSFTDTSTYQHYQGTGKEIKMSQADKDGSISRGTLGLFNGRLTVLDQGEVEQRDPPQSTQKKVAFVEDESKEVRGILKRGASNGNAGISGVKGMQSKFNVHDSLEIAKKHMQHSEGVKQNKKRKKAVRFADLHYEQVMEDDTDSSDSGKEVTAAASKDNTRDDQKTAQETPAQQSVTQRTRPASARAVSSTPKSTDTKTKPPRVASAGPTRHTPAMRPKAAAHIIMSGENQNQNQNMHYTHHAGEASAHGITVHKSQLEKKVMLINNNFMSRVPVYTGATSANNSTNTTSVFTVTQGHHTSVTQPTSSTNTAQRSGVSKMINNDQPKTTNGRVMVVPTIQNAMVLPSHSHFSAANNTNNSAYKAVYNENGLRIDRTPTDDEINNLWQNMRTILEMGGGEKGVTGTAAVATHNGDQQPASRQTVHVSNKYIDGDSLGLNPLMHAANGAVHSNGGGMQKGVNGGSRIGSGSASAFTRTVPATGGQPAQSARPTGGQPAQSAQPNGGQPAQSAQPKSAGQQKNGYLQRYSLLQQRRNPGTGIGSTVRNTGVVEQTLHPMPTSSNTQDPRYTQLNTSGYAPREEITESMAGFLAAEQMVQAHGTGVSDSRIMMAMDNAQQQQETYNSIRQKYAKGGPAALSMEEHRLLESLDRLNDRLKAVEDRAPVCQPSPYGGVSPGHQVFVHSSGFRGSHVRTSQRRPFGGEIRPTSSRLLNRLHY